MTPTLTANNGRLDRATLVAVGVLVDGHPALFRPDAAASLHRAIANGCPLEDVTSAYRDLAEQQDMIDEYGYPHAEWPGRSFHGEAIAGDFRGAMLAWLRAHGAAYGWTFPIPTEPWHGLYDRVTDTHAQEDDMATPQQIADAVIGAEITVGTAGLPAKVPLGALLRDIAAHARYGAARDSGDPKQIASLIADDLGHDLAAQVATELSNRLKG